MNTIIEENIWENLKLEEAKESAYDLLITQTDNFSKATKSELTMEVEVTTGSVGQTSMGTTHSVRIYTLYIVVPSLGNFRKEILRVGEYADIGKFPVDIYDLSESGSPKYKDVEKEDFLKRVKEILSTDNVQSVIRNLYNQSLHVKKYSLDTQYQ